MLCAMLYHPDLPDGYGMTRIAVLPPVGARFEQVEQPGGKIVVRGRVARVLVLNVTGSPAAVEEYEPMAHLAIYLVPEEADELDWRAPDALTWQAAVDFLEARADEVRAAARKYLELGQQNLAADASTRAGLYSLHATQLREEAKKRGQR